LLPTDPAARALSRLAVWSFDDRLGDDYYAVRRREAGSQERLERRLADLDAELAGRPYLGGASYGLADIAYLPWLPRAEVYLGVELDAFPALEAWVERLAERPAVAAELDLARALVP
jgi:glutathione S-transferase